MTTDGIDPPAPLPKVPRAVRLAVAPLPLVPLGRVLQGLTRRLAAGHPDMLRRMGEHADRRFLIDITDLPHVLLLRPRALSLVAWRRGQAPAHDVRLAGPLSAFLSMMHGAADGDALFFSRDFVVEGDTAAALALRNAMDDAELDLRAEIAAVAGPLAPLLRPVLAGAERLTGLVLHRVDPNEGMM